ncbi:MAG: SUF system Fe-S cluster assembly regulator [Sphingomonadaceae bacterium]|nr:SUF system Fe-S cluster assembly regulator [Sphingomonadaceae bacterium]
MRLTNLADYAVVVMTAAAKACDSRLSAGSVAATTGLPVPTVAKLMGSLAKAGLLDSSRGVAGGFGLARAASEISLADIVEAIDGPIALTSCAHDATASDCAISGGCAVKPHLSIVTRTVRDALDAVTLAQLAGNEAAPLGASAVPQFEEA